VLDQFFQDMQYGTKTRSTNEEATKNYNKIDGAIAWKDAEDNKYIEITAP